MATLFIEPIVTLKQGKLKGKSNKSPNGFFYYSFNGVPYAEPPVGSLRFKDPVPSKPWTHIKDATNEGNISMQIDFLTGGLEGDDDCLYLNIHVPQITKQDMKFPVMVQIHGGGFAVGSGSASLFNPGFLVEQNVIVVSINYRLNVLGFLCTDAVNARGDMGLKDQNMALRWIYENIENFGGDQDNITIFGESAGAGSVEYHILSDKSKRLFTKAILSSGSAFCPWARNLNPINAAKKIAERLGYTSERNDDLFDFINSFESKKLVETAAGLSGNEDMKNGMFSLFLPAINMFHDGNDFINQEPIAILKSGKFNKVPAISGICEKEGIFMSIFFASEEFKQDFENGRFVNFIPSFLRKNYKGDINRCSEIYKKKPEDKNPNEDIIDFLGDLVIVGGSDFSLQNRLLHCEEKQYFYNFSHNGNLNGSSIKFEYSTKMVGATHADDLAYIATVDGTNAMPSADDSFVRDQMVEMLANFIKTGDPTPASSKVKWLPLDKKNFRYLEVNSDMTMKTELFDDRRKFWRELYNSLL